METRKSKNCFTAIAFLLFALIFMLFCIIGARFHALLSQPKEANATPASDIVIIDAGHGGEDGGAVSKSGICEKDINLRLSMLLGDIFDAAGYSAVQTRTEDRLLYDRNVDFHGRKKILDMAARLDIAKSRNAELFISIHMNAFPQPIYRGLQVYYSPHHKDSENIAKSIQALAKISLQPTNKRDVKSSGGKIYLLDKLDYPAVLVECGFLSNPDEAALLCEEGYLQKLAFVIFAAANDNIGASPSTLG